jgi:hypothetical protein
MSFSEWMWALRYEDGLMNTIEHLQKWYQSQCDGDWEHA